MRLVITYLSAKIVASFIALYVLTIPFSYYSILLLFILHCNVFWIYLYTLVCFLISYRLCHSSVVRLVCIIKQRVTYLVLRVLTRISLLLFIQLTGIDWYLRIGLVNYILVLSSSISITHCLAVIND